MSTPKFLIDYAVEGQAHGEITFNEALNSLETMSSLAIVDRDLTAPPGSPAEGAAYLVASGGTGAWSSHDNDIAFYFSGWKFLTPVEGQTAWIKDENIFLIYDGATWQNISTTLSDFLSIYTVTSGTYTRGLFPGANSSVAAFGANLLHGVPIIVPKTMTVSHLSIQCALASSGNCRLGIYADSAGLPGVLLRQTGSQALSDSTLHDIDITDITLNFGRYWLAFETDQALTTVGQTSPTGDVNGMIPLYNSSTSLVQVGFVRIAHTYGTLPDPFGTPTFFSEGGPRIALKIV